ncbi:MAG: nucleotidyltransferase domain-containing protein [bacterium]
MSKSKKSKSLSKNEILDFLKKNKLYIKKEFGVTKIALFGSYSRDEQKIASDIDLLIEAKEHDFRKRMQLKRFLEESFNKKVDVGYFDAVRFAIKRNIQKDLIYA